MADIEQQLERFRQGDEFRGGVESLLIDGKPNPEVLDRLALALRTETEQVRLQVARLLITMGRDIDVLHGQGGNLIRNRRIVAILVQDGLSPVGEAREESLDALHESVPAEMLREHAEELITDLRAVPDSTMFLILAKAKAPDARPVIEEFSHTPGWSGEQEVAIALAALGDEAKETEFIDRFLKTTDPQRKAELARVLGFIGTRPALKALAGEMRTDLVVEMKMVYDRSVRMDIMAALSYAFPDRPFLYDNAVLDDEGYARVEKFCEEEFGIEWKVPRPPFLTIQGYPSGVD